MEAVREAEENKNKGGHRNRGREEKTFPSLLALGKQQADFLVCPCHFYNQSMSSGIKIQNCHIWKKQILLLFCQTPLQLGLAILRNEMFQEVC